MSGSTQHAEITIEAIRAWVRKLNPDGDPEFGSHGIILCPATGEVFKTKADTIAYTQETKITDFAILWVKVEKSNTDPSGWTVVPRNGNQPPTGEEKKQEDAAREEQRLAMQQQKERDMNAMFEETMSSVNSDLRAKEASDAADADLVMASKADRERILREKEAQGALARQEEELQAKRRQEARAAQRSKEKDIQDQLNSNKKSTEEKMPPQKKVFGMWINDKLVKSGNPAIRVADLEQELQDGTVLAQLLQALTGDEIEGIDWQPGNPLQIAANFHILWGLMTRHEGIDLGGVNATNVMREPPVLKTDLALIWRLIQKYELVDDGQGQVEGLLAWAAPRSVGDHEAAPKSPASNFTTAWKDGLGFLALADSVAPGSVDWGKVQEVDSNEVRLNMGFKIFLTHLGVPMLLEAEDLEGRSDVEMKQEVMVYIGAIKNAVAQQEDGADKLFNEANAMYVQALLEGRTAEEEIYSHTKEQIQSCMYGGDNNVDELIADALNQLALTSEKFITARQAFDSAKETYLSSKTKEGNEMASKCQDKSAAAVAQPSVLHKSLQEGLLALKMQWQIQVEVEEGDAIVGEVDALMDGLVSHIGTWAEEEVHNNTGEDFRAKLKSQAKAFVTKKAEPLLAAKEHYKKAYQLSSDSAVKRQMVKKIEAIDDIIDGYNSQVLDVVNTAIFNNDKNKKSEAEDILKIYHQFSQRIDALAQKMDLPDAPLSKEPGVAAARLAIIKQRINDAFARDCNLREQLHAAVDQTYTEEQLP